MRRVAPAVLGLALLGAVPARAEDFVPAGPLGAMTLDLDTEAGRYSQWHLDRLDGIDALRATLQIHRLGQDPRWAPGFTILLESGADNVAFQIAARERKAPLAMEVSSSKGGKQIEDQDFERTVLIDEKLDVAIDWTQNGTVTLLVGGEKHTIVLGEPIRALHISCSAGEVEFAPLALGRGPH